MKPSFEGFFVESIRLTTWSGLTNKPHYFLGKKSANPLCLADVSAGTT